MYNGPRRAVQRSSQMRGGLPGKSNGSASLQTLRSSQRASSTERAQGWTAKGCRAKVELLPAKRAATA
eukprot:1353959-Pleurochrysis_carterae.AAC.3